MGEPSDFDTLIGWLSERAGKSVYIEAVPTTPTRWKHPRGRSAVAAAV